jgi:hypothetical protein
VRRVILRSQREKADPLLCWNRPDERFFATGACHVLAGVFLKIYPNAGFSCWLVRPRSAARGLHVVAARDDLVFDACGFTARHDFLSEYTRAIREHLPEWTGDLQPSQFEPLGWEFARSTNSRHPSQFVHDPVARARQFLLSFPEPPPAPH